MGREEGQKERTYCPKDLYDCYKVAIHHLQKKRKTETETETEREREERERETPHTGS